ncbi:hypothetical protein D3C80_1474950 [compost metagenome]
MDLRALDQIGPRRPLEPVLDPARISLALAARADHGTVRRLDQTRRASPADGFQPHAAPEPGYGRARLQRRARDPRRQSVGDPFGLGAGEGHDLGQATLRWGHGHGFADASIDADRQPSCARVHRQAKGASALKRQPLTVPVLHSGSRSGR